MDAHDTDRSDEHLGATSPEISRIECDSAGKLVVYLADQDDPIPNASIARCFPWSFPQAYISIRDEAGREVTLLESLETLDDASRSVVEAELHHKIFNPRITRVTECRTEFGVTTIEAETDRGPVSLQIASRDEVRYLNAHRLLLQDVDGNTFEIEDLSTLDTESRRRLGAFL